MKSKQDFNMHTHTKRCGHAYGDDEQYVLAAIDAGFKQLGLVNISVIHGLIYRQTACFIGILMII